jgi:CelD/BcsL family acetyltransferase involved in cellulose biosynthesis
VTAELAPARVGLDEGRGAAPSAARVVTIERSTLGPWRARWDELVLTSPLPSPFLRSWWLEHTAVGGPRFVLVVAGDRLLGGLALQIDQRFGVPRYRALGQSWLVPDHLDVVVDAGYADVVRSALAAWCLRPGDRLLDLEGVAADGMLATILPPTASARTIDRAPYLDLRGGLDAVASRLPSRLRNTIRRQQRRLEQAGVHHRVVPVEGSGIALTELRRLHELRWAAGSGFLGRFEAFRAAAVAGAAVGDVIVHQLARGEEVLASQVDLRAGDRVAYYQAGRRMDPEARAAGSVLLWLAIGHAWRGGAVEYDLLRGSEPYKDDWATGARPVVRIEAAVGPRAARAAWLLRQREQLARRKGQLRHQAEDRQARRRSVATVPVRSRDDLAAVEAAWGQLRADTRGPTTQLAWLRAYVDAPPIGHRPLLVTVTDERGVAAVAALVRRDGRLGLLGEELGEPSGLRYRDEAALDRLLAALLACRRPLDLQPLPADSPTAARLRELVGRRRLVRHTSWPACPSITLDPTWRTPTQHLSARRRADQARARRRAEALGAVRAEILRPTPDEVAPLLAELVRIEGAGWKGEAGTALAADPWRQRFFGRYAAEAAADGTLRFARLRIGDETAAVQLAVVVDRSYWLLKIGYDERFRRASPGALLLEETIARAARDGLRSYEFLGAVAAWTRVWTEQELELQRTRIYPPSLPGAAALASDAAAKAQARWTTRSEP